jgi:hypothetical protein
VRLDVVAVLEMIAWSVLLPVLKRALPLRRLVRLMWAQGPASQSEPEARHIVALSSSLTRLGFRRRSNCVERSLLAYRFLSRAGADPRLVVGVGNVNGKIAGHAWVTVDGVPVHEPPEAVACFAPLIEFGRGGRPTDGRGVADENLPAVWQ